MLKTEHNFFYQLMSILFDIQNCGLTEQVEKPNRSASYSVLDESDARALVYKEGDSFIHASCWHEYWSMLFLAEWFSLEFLSSLIH